MPRFRQTFQTGSRERVKPLRLNQLADTMCTSTLGMIPVAFPVALDVTMLHFRNLVPITLMQIGIISDTHGFLDPKVFEAFEDCDEIWHAGDFGSLEIAEQLADFKPLKGVYGNIDDSSLRQSYPENLRFDCDGVDVLMTHIAGRPGRYPSRVKRLLEDSTPDVLVCGHSHIVQVENDLKHKKMKYINPGAAGHEGQHVMRTLIKLQCKKGKLRDMKLVELGPRGRASNVN